MTERLVALVKARLAGKSGSESVEVIVPRDAREALKLRAGCLLRVVVDEKRGSITYEMASRHVLSARLEKLSARAK
jgi:DNA replicative helicase MCM subunit Mcm2 (Cdc46/Mcm family)